MKAYIKVNVGAELPKRNGKYQTNLGELDYVKCIGFYGFKDGESVWYWLKEVTIPDEEEMEAVAGEIAGVASLNNLHNEKPVLYGALKMKEWLLSKLK